MWRKNDVNIELEVTMLGLEILAAFAIYLGAIAAFTSDD